MVRRGRLVVTLLFGLAAGACKDAPRHEFGHACLDDDDCFRGLLCVAAVQGAKKGTCTKSCGAESECPEGWSCGAVTQRGVLTCRRGSSVPFMNAPPPGKGR